MYFVKILSYAITKAIFFFSRGTPYFGALVWFIARIGLDGKVKGQRQGEKEEKK